MYKTALGAAPFNNETTREVGGGMEQGPMAATPQPKKHRELPRNPAGGGGGKPSQQLTPGQGLGSESLPQWRLERSPRSWLQPPRRLLSSPLGGLSPGRVLASQEPKFPQLRVGHGGKAATGVMQF